MAENGIGEAETEVANELSALADVLGGAPDEMPEDVIDRLMPALERWIDLKIQRALEEWDGEPVTRAE